MKTNEVRPETFLQAVGQYSYDDSMQGLGVIGMSNEDVLLGLAGLGRLGQASTLDSVVQTYGEMAAKQAALSKARKKAADGNPMAAAAFKKAAERTSAPGTNEARGVMETMKVAAAKAQKAKREEAEAKKLLAQNDRRAAAAKAATAMTSAREALTLANKAEKTRLARSLDITIHTLQSQAKYLDDQAQTEVRRSGPSARATALSATAQNLRQEADKLKKYSAVVAAQPDVPPEAPSAQRIADVASKFNIRTAGRDRFMRRQAMLSVLGDLANDPMAQTKDYGGALSYYGDDQVGRLMADIEFANPNAFLQGLRGAVHGLGQASLMPIYAQAQRAIDQGQAVARQAYSTAVLPAAGLGGLGALGGDKEDWAGWCARRIGPGKQTDDPVANKYKSLEQCQEWGIFYSAPWSCKGLLERQAINWGEAGVCTFQGIGKWITSGQASKDIGAASQTVQQATQTAQQAGQAVQQAAQQAGSLTKQPPASTIPAAQFDPGRDIAAQRSQFQPQPQKKGLSTGAMVAIGGGILAVGAAAFLLTRPRA